MLRLLLVTFAFYPCLCYAVGTSFDREELAIPKKPSTPPPLNQKIPTEYPHCERFFLYRGKRLECDSNVGKDAERLRPLMQDVPSALNELNIYQDNRDKIKAAAYLGTAGIVALIVGAIISRPPFDPATGAPRAGGYVMLGGLGVAANSLIYGFSVVKSNEAHIGNAVRYYNTAHPDNPIELQFSTRVNF